MNPTERKLDKQTIFDVIRPARERFAAVNGWQVSLRGFDIEALVSSHPPEFLYWGRSSNNDPSLLDHKEFYRDRGRPAALVAHSYAPNAQPRAEALARRLGIRAICSATASWWYPSRATLLIFVPAGTEVIIPTDAEIAEFTRAHAEFQAELDRRRHTERMERRMGLA